MRSENPIKLTTINGVRIPVNIYRYLTIDNNFYNSILQNYLWFSKPTDFNDPYDCNLSISHTFNEKDLYSFYLKTKEYYENIGISEFSSFNIDERVELFNKNPKEFMEAMESGLKKIYSNDFGVCCFSEKKDNLIMWSHYADKHKGVCLGFNILKDTFFFNVPFKVVYSKKYPIFEYIKERLGNRKLSSQFHLATKSKDWAYEKEIRIIKTKDNENFQGAISFLKSSLVEVIFGCKANDDEVRNIIDLMKLTNYLCRFSKMGLKEFEFGLVESIID